MNQPTTNLYDMLPHNPRYYLGYKLLKLRANGTLGSLFVNSSAVLPIGKWMWCRDDHPHPGLAHRPGWHIMRLPIAPHLSTKGRVWCKVEAAYVQWMRRPKSQGGEWMLARRMKILGICHAHEIL